METCSLIISGLFDERFFYLHRGIVSERISLMAFLPKRRPILESTDVRQLTDLSEFCAVITTVQEPTLAVRHLSKMMSRSGGKLLVVGDEKSPSSYELEKCEYLSLSMQKRQSLKLAELLPENRYSRKNLGYLSAIQGGASCIYETDDDNFPLNGWRIRQRNATAYEVLQSGWVNVYRGFSDELIWPRGFPLEQIGQSMKETLPVSTHRRSVEAPVQQGLASGSPDVDAIWRLTQNREVSFSAGRSLYLPPGSWCPFNSQSTWWWPEAYPLLYLPTYCSFRMTDIWRSFVAQACLWAMGYGVVFHPQEVYQQRNHHDLLDDFHSEMRGYEVNGELARGLASLELEKSQSRVGNNLLACYEFLVRQEYLPPRELELVTAWLDDVQATLRITMELA